MGACPFVHRVSDSVVCGCVFAHALVCRACCARACAQEPHLEWLKEARKRRKVAAANAPDGEEPDAMAEVPAVARQ